MELISFPRYDLDGHSYTQGEIEYSFVKNLPTEISDRLNNVKTTSCREEKCIKLLKKYVEYLLLAKPSELARIKKWSDCVNLFGEIGNPRTDDFKKDILAAFDYDGYRKKHLVKHAERLNVKTCCYCNLNYTLLIEEKKAGSVDMKVLMQFDHFFDKDLYPHLSMSMYNLIPCCATCNQGKKRTGDLPIYYNPYHSSIFELYQFKVKNPLDLYLGVSYPDKIDVECVQTTSKDVSACNEWFHLSAKYSVHKDIVKEVFDKAKQYPYYVNPDNFNFMNGDPQYLLRLLLGVYPDMENMGKRPMSKFITDLWKQALVYHGKTVCP